MPSIRAGFLPLLVLILAPSMPASAQGISAGQASKILDACVAHAKSRGQSQAIAVYDDGGHMVAFLRMDGNPPGVADFGMQKAAAVAHWHFSTAEMANAAKGTPGFASAPLVVTVLGGVPIFSVDGKTFLGAVGVSGEAPADDAACAEAGVQGAGLAFVHKAEK